MDNEIFNQFNVEKNLAMRKASLLDREKIADFHFNNMMHQMTTTEEEQKWFKDTQTSYFKHLLENDLFNKTIHWLVEEISTGIVVGTIGLKKLEQADVRLLISFSVNKAFRNQGIGSSLLDQLLSYSKQQRFNKILLETTTLSQQASLMYLKIGFKLYEVDKFERLNVERYELVLNKQLNENQG